MPQISGLLTNLPELSAAARASGHINSLPDARDGSVRWAPLVLRYQGLFFPSADVQAVRLYLNNPAFALHTTRYGISGLQFGERLIPTDEYGRALIHYRGPPRSFPTWSVSDVLAGRIDARGKNVVIVLSGGNVDADLFARLVA